MLSVLVLVVASRWSRVDRGNFFLFHGLRLSLSAVENLRAHGEGPVKRTKNQNCLTGDNRSNGTSKKVGQKTAVTRLLPTGFLHDISLPVDISRASTAKEGVFYFATPGGIFTRRTVNQAILKPKEDGNFFISANTTCMKDKTVQGG